MAKRKIDAPSDACTNKVVTEVEQASKRRKKTPKSTSRKAQPSETKATPSPMLNLPAELRNEIYRLALVQENRLEVTKRTRWQPGLTRVNKQIRQESLSIFLGENKFRLKVQSGLPAAPPTHWIAAGTPGNRVAFRFNGRETWPNLMRWLEMVHEGRYQYPRGGKGGAKMVAIKQAFRIVGAMGTVSWSVVRDVLEVYRAGLAVAKPGWTWVKQGVE